MREHRFTFDDELRAKLFVRRLCLMLTNLAIFRDGCVVRVLDGSPRGQATEIVRLARMSGSLPSATDV